MRQVSLPLRVEAIDIDFYERSHEMFVITLKIDGKEQPVISEVKSGQHLHWNPDFVIHIRPSSQIKVKLRCKSRKLLTFTPRLPDTLDVSLAGDEVLKVCTGNDRSGVTRVITKSNKAFTASIKFAEDTANIEGSKLAAENAVEVSNETLDALAHLDRVRNVIDPMMDILGEIVTIHPVAKAAVSAVTIAYDHIKKQAQCDSNVTDLATNMLAMLSAVEVAKDKAAIKCFIDTIEDILILVEDAAKFIVRYQSDVLAMRALKSLVCSTAQQAVDDYIKRFQNLKETFDRSSTMQMLDTLNDIDGQTILGALSRSPYAQYNPDDACMEGTRDKILQDIEIWTSDVTHSKHLLWVNALAGAGKTAISSSIAKYLDDRKCLGACYFFKRGFSSPIEFIPTVVSRLAEVYQPFKKALIAVLRNNGGLGTHPVSVQFARLLEEPIQKLKSGSSPTQKLGPGRVFVIVIDALDECGSQDSRKDILSCIEKMAQLAPWLKVMCTSRPELDIVHRFKKFPACYPFSLDINDNTEDIVQVTRAKMKECADMNSLPDTWPGEEKILQLAQRASGLFIWVTTAFKFISGALDPGLCMERVLENRTVGNAYDSLDELYTTALGENLHRQDNVEVFQKVVGVILTARTPLSAETLAELLKDSVSTTAVNNIVAALGSVLYKDTAHDGAIRVCHPSFIDFLTDPERRCPDVLRITPQLHSAALAEVCLTTMERRLEFNICQLESSHYFNRDIRDLDDRIETYIPGHLRYSCLYWASHVNDVPVKNSDLQRGMILNRLESFFSCTQFLYWMEVLSILHAFRNASQALDTICDWASGRDRCLHLANDGRCFVDTFHEVISSSAPHLYLSALPFAPRHSLIARLQQSQFINMINVIEGQRMHWSPQLYVLDYLALDSTIFSPDGRRIASGFFQSIRIWDADSGAAILELGPPFSTDNELTCFAFSPDGRRIVSGSSDSTIQMWNADTGAAISAPLEVHASGVTSVAFSPDGRRIVSRSSDNTIRIWDADTGVAMLTLLEAHTSVTSVTFLPDGRMATVSEYRKIQIWDVDSGAVISTFLLDHPFGVTSFAFSPNGGQIVSGSGDGTIRVWDTDTGAAILTLPIGHRGMATAVAFSPDGRRIASASKDHTIQMWDADTGATISTPLEGHSKRVVSIAFSPDGRRIVSNSLDETIRMWDADVGAAVSTPPEGHTSFVTSVAFSPDGRRVVSASLDKTIRMWDADAGAEVSAPLEGHTSSIFSVTFSPDGQRIVSGSADETIRVWNASTGATISKPLKGHTSEVTSVAFSPDGRRIVSGSSDKTIRMWNADTGAAISMPLIGHKDRVTCVTFSPDNQRIVSGSADKTIRLWDADTGAEISAPLEGHTSCVSSVAFSPAGQRIVSACFDCKIIIWDAEGCVVISMPTKVSDRISSTTCVAFSPDGRQIVSGCVSNKIRMWDSDTGAAISVALEGHTSSVTSVAFSPDGLRFVSGSRDNTIRMWDASASTATSMSLEDHTPVVSDSGNNDVNLQSSGQMILSKSLPSWLRPPGRDGWIRDSEGNNILWIPWDCRLGLRTTHQRAIFSSSQSVTYAGRLVTLDVSSFCYGYDWQKVKI